MFQINVIQIVKDGKAVTWFLGRVWLGHPLLMVLTISSKTYVVSVKCVLLYWLYAQLAKLGTEIWYVSPHVYAWAKDQLFKKVSQQCIVMESSENNCQLGMRINSTW